MYTCSSAYSTARTRKHSTDNKHFQIPTRPAHTHRHPDVQTHRHTGALAAYIHITHNIGTIVPTRGRLKSCAALARQCQRQREREREKESERERKREKERERETETKRERVREREIESERERER